MGRIDLGIAPSDTSGNTVYASIADSSTASETNLGVFVTTNGGSSWTQTAAPDICHFQCWYDNVVKVDPNNKSIVFFGGGAVRDSSGNPSWVFMNVDATQQQIEQAAQNMQATTDHIKKMVEDPVTRDQFSDELREALSDENKEQLDKL